MGFFTEFKRGVVLALMTKGQTLLSAKPVWEMVSAVQYEGRVMYPGKHRAGAMPKAK